MTKIISSDKQTQHKPTNSLFCLARVKQHDRCGAASTIIIIGKIVPTAVTELVYIHTHTYIHTDEDIEISAGFNTPHTSLSRAQPFRETEYLLS